MHDARWLQQRPPPRDPASHLSSATVLQGGGRRTAALGSTRDLALRSLQFHSEAVDRLAPSSAVQVWSWRWWWAEPLMFTCLHRESPPSWCFLPRRLFMYFGFRPFFCCNVQKSSRISVIISILAAFLHILLAAAHPLAACAVVSRLSR